MSLAPLPSNDDAFTALRAFLLSVLPAGVEVVQSQDNRVAQPVGPNFVTMNGVGRRRISANVTSYADCAFMGSVDGAALTVAALRLGRVVSGAPLLGAGVLAGTTILAQRSGVPGGAGVYALSQAQQTAIPLQPLSAGLALIKQPVELSIQVDAYGEGAADNAATMTTLLRDGYSDLWFRRQRYFDRGIAVLDVGEPRQIPFTDGESQVEDRWTFDVMLQLDQVTAAPQDFADAIGVAIESQADRPST